jgi:hypothetical protein
MVAEKDNLGATPCFFDSRSTVNMGRVSHRRDTTLHMEWYRKQSCTLDPSFSNPLGSQILIYRRTATWKICEISPKEQLLTFRFSTQGYLWRERNNSNGVGVIHAPLAHRTEPAKFSQAQSQHRLIPLMLAEVNSKKARKSEHGRAKSSAQF